MYCSTQDLIHSLSLFGGEYLADFDGDGNADTATLERMIVEASSIVDGYIGGVYVLPLAGSPELVKTITLDIAIYRLASSDKGTLTEEIVKRRDDALKVLAQLRDGKMVLQGEAKKSALGGATSSDGTTGGVLMDTAPRRFSRQTLEVR